MRKNLKYFIISIVLIFCYSINVNALDCYYVKNYGDINNDGEQEILSADFRINDGNSEGKNKGKIVFSGVFGVIKSKDDNNSSLPSNYRTVEGQGQKIENWNTAFDPSFEAGTVIDFIGVNYYKNNGKCPPFAILVDRSGQFDFAVLDEYGSESYKKFEEYGKSKQGYAILTLQSQSEDSVNYYPSSCLGLNRKSCQINKNFACVWNEKNVGGKSYKYCNVDNLLYVSCGDTRDIPIQVPALISFFVNFLKIVTPIILIFIGIISLVKALSASKEDEIKKAQGSLIKKMIAAAMVFLVITIVQFVVSFVADNEYRSDFNELTEKDNLSSCLECFLDNDCEKTAYYKTNISGQDYCTNLNNGDFNLCPEEQVK